MNASQKPSTRLTRLDEILAQSPPHQPNRTGDLDPEQARLASVPLDRIGALSAELKQRSDTPQDDIDALTMRLLLNDYRTAVAHLRAVANSTEARLRTSGDAINRMTKELRREQEMAEKRAGRDPQTAD
jgi:hypothetical protein